jgi:hypothetical protein
MTGLVLDPVASVSHDRGMARAADVTIAVGFAEAAGAAITVSEIGPKHRAARVAQASSTAC